MGLNYNKQEIKPYQELFNKIRTSEDDFIRSLIKGLGVNINKKDIDISKELKDKNLKLTITDCFQDRYYYCNGVKIGHRCKIHDCENNKIEFIYRKVDEDEY